VTYWAEYAGVYFIEGPNAGAAIISKIDTKHDGGFSQSQLKSLDTIKGVMAQKVKAAGGNAVVDFSYGQRSTFWRSLLSIDDVYWFATGFIAKVARPPS
jgi:hypothetical protein